MTKRLMVVGVLAAFLAALPGCLIMTGRSIEEDGVRVSSATLNEVVPGETTESWLVAALGPPTSREPVADQPGTSILRYEHVLEKSSRGTVLFIFAGGSKRREAHTTYFEVLDGVVTRYWSEG